MLPQEEEQEEGGGRQSGSGGAGGRGLFGIGQNGLEEGPAGAGGRKCAQKKAVNSCDAGWWVLSLTGKTPEACGLGGEPCCFLIIVIAEPPRLATGNRPAKLENLDGASHRSLSPAP